MALKSCPKSNKLPNVVTLLSSDGCMGFEVLCVYSVLYQTAYDKYSTNTINEKAYIACLGLEPRVAGW